MSPSPRRLRTVPALLLGLLAFPAWARDISIPAKNPAIGLTVPETWDITDTDDGMQAQSPDKTVNFYLEYGPRSELDARLKNNRAWMKRSKINGAVKPTERSLDFAGVPGRVIRYDTRDKDGKTLVDFVVLEASGNRIVMLTLWGSEDQRADNEADIAAIMKSVRVTPSTTGFWAGGRAAKPDSAAPELPKSAAVNPEAPKAAAPIPEMPLAAASAPEAPKVVAAPAPEMPKATAALPASPAQNLEARRVVFVKRKADQYGDVDPRNSDAFGRNEDAILYLEPVGEAVTAVTTTQSRFGLVIDCEIRRPDTTVVLGQKAVIDRELTRDTATLAGRDPNFFVNLTVGLSTLEPGPHVLELTLRDKFSDRVSLIRKPFTVSAAPEAAR